MLYQKTKFYTLFHHENSKQTRVEQIAFNHSSDIGFEDFINLYKKCTAKSYNFWDNCTTLASDSSLHFICNLLRDNVKNNHKN